MIRRDILASRTCRIFGAQVTNATCKSSPQLRTLGGCSRFRPFMVAPSSKTGHQDALGRRSLASPPATPATVTPEDTRSSADVAELSLGPDGDVVLLFRDHGSQFPAFRRLTFRAYSDLRSRLAI